MGLGTATSRLQELGSEPGPRPPGRPPGPPGPGPVCTGQPPVPTFTMSRFLPWKVMSVSWFMGTTSGLGFRNWGQLSSCRGQAWSGAAWPGPSSPTPHEHPRPLTMWAGTMLLLGVGEASSHLWFCRSHWQVQRLLAQEMHLGEGSAGAGGAGVGWGGQSRGAGQVQHSRQVLLQAHGLRAVVEGIRVGGEEDVALFEQELDAHGHVVCRKHRGTVPGGGHGAQGKADTAGVAGAGPPPAAGPCPITAPKGPSSTEPEAECEKPCSAAGVPWGPQAEHTCHLPAIRWRLRCLPAPRALYRLCPCRGPGAWGRAPARSLHVTACLLPASAHCPPMALNTLGTEARRLTWPTFSARPLGTAPPVSSWTVGEGLPHRCRSPEPGAPVLLRQGDTVARQEVLEGSLSPTAAGRGQAPMPTSNDSGPPGVDLPVGLAAQLRPGGAVSREGLSGWRK